MFTLKRGFSGSGNLPVPMKFGPGSQSLASLLYKLSSTTDAVFSEVHNQ